VNYLGAMLRSNRVENHGQFFYCFDFAVVGHASVLSAIGVERTVPPPLELDKASVKIVARRRKEICTKQDHKLYQARESRETRGRVRGQSTRVKNTARSVLVCDKVRPPSETETGSAGEQPVEG
jgi:hypothetical protein